MTGIHPMTGAVDAFAARALLAEYAERSLDVQYYIWHGDSTRPGQVAGHPTTLPIRATRSIADYGPKRSQHKTRGLVDCVQFVCRSRDQIRQGQADLSRDEGQVTL